MYEPTLILLVDDDDNDCTLIRRAFIRAKVLNPVIVARSGEEAMDYLSGVGKYADHTEFPLPAVVLLDIKMPGLSGLDVLRWIRSQSGLGTIRVVMLTSSDDTKDVDLAYQLGANSFLTKPMDHEQFVEIARALSGYWLWMDKAPRALRPPLFAPINPESEPPRRAHGA